MDVIFRLLILFDVDSKWVGYRGDWGERERERERVSAVSRFATSTESSQRRRLGRQVPGRCSSVSSVKRQDDDDGCRVGRQHSTAPRWLFRIGDKRRDGESCGGRRRRRVVMHKAEFSFFVTGNISPWKKSRRNVEQKQLLASEPIHIGHRFLFLFVCSSSKTDCGGFLAERREEEEGEEEKN